MNYLNDNENWTNEVIADWKRSGTKMNTGLSLSQIRCVESKLEFKFPPDFIELYQKVNGFRNFDWNEHMFSFWSLDRIVDEHRSEGEDFIGFCDFLINSYSIGFLKDNFAIYKSYDRLEPIAKTFREAVFMINKSDDSIY